jgi:phenylpyruvate tautomerase PptA (4-oxalocrotonate tautomerase family)
MYKLGYGLSVILLLISTGCSSQGNLVTSAANNQQQLSSAKLIGGWSPVFFKSYNSNQITNIIDQVNSKRVVNIKITYFSNQAKLAKQINQAIIDNTHLTPQLTEVNLQNTQTLKYDKQSVVVTLYYSH